MPQKKKTKIFLDQDAEQTPLEELFLQEVILYKEKRLYLKEELPIATAEVIAYSELHNKLKKEIERESHLYVADKLNIPLASVWRVSMMKYYPSLPVFLKMFAYFKIDLDKLGFDVIEDDVRYYPQITNKPRILFYFLNGLSRNYAFHYDLYGERIYNIIGITKSFGDHLRDRTWMNSFDLKNSFVNSIRTAVFFKKNIKRLIKDGSVKKKKFSID